jgi:hypothetical protein
MTSDTIEREENNVDPSGLGERAVRWLKLLAVRLFPSGELNVDKFLPIAKARDGIITTQTWTAKSAASLSHPFWLRVVTNVVQKQNHSIKH